MPQNSNTPAPIFIVTGSTPDAELHDRPLAYRVREVIAELLAAEYPDLPRAPAVCSDLWYLNQDHLRAEPAISLGSPQVNAFTAFLTDRLPSLRVIDGRWIVQGEPDFDPALAACWGVTPHLTSEAVAIFLNEYAATFLESLADRDDR